MELKKRNFALLGHAQSGKTTISEALIFKAGATSRKGTVEEGNTISDYGSDEIERKVSISSSILSFKYKDYAFQIIDTPGYADFIGEVISSIRAVDSAVVVVDAINSVEVGTERVWQMLDNAGLPRIVFVNKLDKEGADLNKAVADIQEHLSKNAQIIKTPFSSSLIETIAETDDALLEKYLEGKDLTSDELNSALKKAVLNGKVYPIISGSAQKDEGIEELLKSAVDYLPSPIERPKIICKDPVSNEEKELVVSPDGPLSAFVFKTISDPYVGLLTIFRIFQGELLANTNFYNVSKNARERIGPIYFLKGKEQVTAEKATCGDIVAVTKLKDTATSDTLGKDEKSFVFPPIVFPETAISSSVKPKSRQDEEKISSALSKLSTEDPTFKVTRDAQTKELIISGVGDLHLDIMVNRLKQKFNVDVELGTPKVAYKETVTKSAKVQGKYKRQSGGRGQYGDVWIEIEPLERGKDFEFVDKIFGGAIPKNFIPSVEKGVREACSEGILAGYPLVDVKVTLYDGSFHAVDSSDIAFKIAGAMALRKAALQAGPVLLEPIMDLEVVIPEEYMGQVSGDLNSRRGRIMGIDVKGKLQIVKAKVPLAEIFKYANDLRSMTGGRGAYTIRFSHYETVPQKTISQIVAQSQKKKEKE